MKKIGVVVIDGETLQINLLQYRDGRPALELLSEDDSPYGVFSVNVPNEPLSQGEIFVKTWNENEQLRQPMLDTGLFTDTGRRVPCGFVDAEVWKLHI